MEDKKYIIALESSSSICSAAISADGEVLAEYSVFKPNYHDRMMAELVNRLLKDFNLSVGDLSAVAVSAGPGSFTGLRISASIAKGLCYGGSPKLIAVPTMKAIASAFIKKRKGDFEVFEVMLASHKDFVYRQSFDEHCNELSEVQYSKLEEIPDEDKTKFIAVCGLPENMLVSLLQMRIDLSASLISSLAWKMFCDEDFSDPSEFTPLYVQEFVVKVPGKV